MISPTISIHIDSIYIVGRLCCHRFSARVNCTRLWTYLAVAWRHVLWPRTLFGEVGQRARRQPCSPVSCKHPSVQCSLNSDHFICRTRWFAPKIKKKLCFVVVAVIVFVCVLVAVLSTETDLMVDWLVDWSVGHPAGWRVSRTLVQCIHVLMCAGESD